MVSLTQDWRGRDQSSQMGRKFSRELDFVGQNQLRKYDVAVLPIKVWV